MSKGDIQPDASRASGHVLKFKRQGKNKDGAMQSRSYQVLFIGDDSSQMQSILQMLQHEEESIFAVSQERNWQTGLPQIASGALDAVVWDIPTDGVDCLTYLRETRAQGNSVLLLVLVSEGEQQFGKQAVEAGAYEYLFKETLNQHLLQKVLRHLIEENRAENAVRQWERRFDDLFENTEDILFTMDLVGTITAMNKAATQIMGWSTSEALQKISAVLSHRGTLLHATK